LQQTLPELAVAVSRFAFSTAAQSKNQDQAACGKANLTATDDRFALFSGASPRWGFSEAA
jgi:hypothetical protein